MGGACSAHDEDEIFIHSLVGKNQRKISVQFNVNDGSDMQHETWPKVGAERPCLM
jgi:hypothetical protein